MKWNNTCSNKYLWLLKVDSHIVFNLYLNVFYCFVLDQVDFTLPYGLEDITLIDLIATCPMHFWIHFYDFNSRDHWRLLHFGFRLKIKSITPSRRFTTNTTAPTQTLPAVPSTMCSGRWEKANNMLLLFFFLNSAHFLCNKNNWLSKLVKKPLKQLQTVNIPAPLLRHSQLLWLEKHPLVQRVQEQQRPSQLLSARHH